MPPLIFLAVAGAGLYVGYKFFSKLIAQAQTPSKADGRNATGVSGQPKNLGGLEWDEKAGAYRPKKAT